MRRGVASEGAGGRTWNIEDGRAAWLRPSLSLRLVSGELVPAVLWDARVDRARGRGALAEAGIPDTSRKRLAFGDSPSPWPQWTHYSRFLLLRRWSLDASLCCSPRQSDPLTLARCPWHASRFAAVGGQARSARQDDAQARMRIGTPLNSPANLNPVECLRLRERLQARRSWRGLPGLPDDSLAAFHVPSNFLQHCEPLGPQPQRQRQRADQGYRTLHSIYSTFRQCQVWLRVDITWR